MSRSIAILLATSMAALLGTARIAHADVIYQWTDAKGEVHYTDQWVPGAKIIRTESARGSVTAANANAMQGIHNEGQAASGAIRQQQETQAVQDDEAKARAARCTQDKEEYQKLIVSRRIFTTDKSGERHYLTDADADAVRLKARQAMDMDCGSGT